MNIRTVEDLQNPRLPADNSFKGCFRFAVWNGYVGGSIRGYGFMVHSCFKHTG
jgi:hypothetical protein